MATNIPGGGPGRTWDQEDLWWRDNYASRPYAGTGRDYDFYRPGYRYGYESGTHHMGRRWDDVEADLRTGWNKYEHRGQSTWDDVKHAVRDAWHRITGQEDETARRRGGAGSTGWTSDPTR